MNKSIISHGCTFSNSIFLSQRIQTELESLFQHNYCSIKIKIACAMTINSFGKMNVFVECQSLGRRAWLKLLPLYTLLIASFGVVKKSKNVMRLPFSKTKHVMHKITLKKKKMTNLLVKYWNIIIT